MNLSWNALSALVGVGVTLASCSSASSAEPIEAGKWEVTTTRFGPGDKLPDRQTSQHCISDKEAKGITVKILLFDGTGNRDHFDDAVMFGGQIRGSSKVNTLDGDLKGIPVEVIGHYEKDSFEVKETFRIYGAEATRTFEGHRISAC